MNQSADYVLDKEKDAKYFNCFTGTFKKEGKQGVRFFVDAECFERNTESETKVFQFEHIHPGALRALDIIEESKSVLYELFDKTFTEYCNELIAQNILPIDKNIEMNGQHVPYLPTLSKITQREYMESLEERFRVSFGKIDSYVSFCHHLGKCTTGFTLKDVVMKGESPALLRLSHEEMTDERVEKDWKCLHGVIMNVFALSTKPHMAIPVDMDKFLTKLLSPVKGERRIHQHLALMTDRQRINFCINVV